MLVAARTLQKSQYLLQFIVKVLCCAYLLLMPFAPKTLSTPLTLANVNHGKEEICGDIDIRNSVANFAKLENCTVIEGNLQILLIDRGVPSDYTNLSFPKLREITDFFLLYRVIGLRTLRNLFPNLTVIRGSKLFHNYALVVYEMMSLQEIGLPSLTNILRGSVHIEKNPQLCYVDTIDWDLIARSGAGHFIKSNKASNQCPNDCPRNVVCPRHHERNTRLCWDSLTCQKVCSGSCSNNSCMSPDRCCHSHCLGGCTVLDSPSSCFVCRGVVYQGRCFESCVPDTYEFAGRRCVTEDECKRMPSRAGKRTTWKLFMKKCLAECPSGYMEHKKDNHTCQECDGPCPKECPGIPVDSVAAAQELRGCTRINGALEIQISGGKNVVRELEENLGKIEEVDHYVKIVRSFPLVSLNFLKNLRKIHGMKKENEHYSLLVFDNHNLQEIMDFKNRTIPLEIVSGKMFFHFNPKLCLSKIEELRNYTKLPKWDDRDVSPTSNGDRVACNIRPLRVWVQPKNKRARMAVINWENFLRNLSDHRSLLAYVVSYKEAPYRNVTLFDGRDACGTDSWKVDDVSASLDNNVEFESHILPDLKPFTQYAVFVRTYTVANEKNGAQSPIIYFTTLPDTPSSPLDLKASSPSPSQLKISWVPPTKPNGNVTHYIIIGYYEKDEQSFLDRRDYCQEPLTVPDRKKGEKLGKDPLYSAYNKTEFPWVKPTNLPENCCSCPKEKKLDEKQDEAQFQIGFEDFIHNYVYVKRPTDGSSSAADENSYQNRRRRSINPLIGERTNNISKATITPPPLPTLATTASVITSTPVTDSSVPPAFKVVVNMTTGVVVSNLKHFSEYTIEVIACHDHNLHNYQRCSEKSITTARTAALEGSDNINNSTIQARVVNGTSGNVYIRWAEPPYPNGLIVSYHIEYKRTNVENYKPIPVCITQKRYREKRSYMLSELGPGNYSVKLKATSLAGDGAWTSLVYFVIPEPSGGMSAGEVAAITATCIIVVIFLIAGTFVYVFKQKLALTVPGSVLYASVNPEYISSAKAYIPDEWEVPRKKISTIKELGRGSFGTVFEGTAKKLKKGQLTTKVAIKTTNPNASADEMFAFLQEASIMKAFDCHHIVRLLGVVSKTAPPLVIMELMSHGDLKTFLRTHNPDDCGVCNKDVDKPESRSLVSSRKSSGKKKKKKEVVDDTPPTLKRLYQMAVEIADGMAYLSAKKFVHRDLAARNCMVAEDMTVKIGDFGLTRDIYLTDYYRKDGKGMLPIRWMAPEAVRDGVFSSQSDVWSYGIVLWEMVTRAAQPYTTMKNTDVVRFVVDGGKMGKPMGCPDKMYHLMSRCWNHTPNRRPTFRMLTSELLSYANERFHKVAFYYTAEAERLAFTEMDIDVEETLPSTPLKLYVVDVNNVSPEFDDDEFELDAFMTVPIDEDSGTEEYLNDPEKRVRTKVIHPPVQCINFDEEERNISTQSSDSSKGISQQSEGSKISGHSANGGLVNGHLHFPVAQSTQC